MSEVIPFPAGRSQPTISGTINYSGQPGPAPGSEAWLCNPCRDDLGEEHDSEFAFYVTRDGVHCWTCHRIQIFD